MKKYKGNIRQTVTISNYGKITATRALLNMIAMFASECAIRREEKYGKNANTSEPQKLADEIFEALKKQGYYEYSKGQD